MLAARGWLVADAITVTIPGLRLVSEANSHAHFRERQKRAKAQNTLVDLVMRTRARVAPPCEVRITRIAPQGLDSDNLAGSAKHVRDALARWIGVDDRNPEVTWHVGQAKGKPREYGVRITVRAFTRDRPGARVSTEAEATHVEVVLTPAQRAGIGRALLAGDGPVAFSLAGIRLTLSATTQGTR